MIFSLKPHALKNHAIVLALAGTLFASHVTAPAQAVEFEPVARLTLLGGQFFFEDEHTSFSGNGDWLLAPAVKFNDRWSLIPTVNGKYRRVREVQELVGGGFLTRETLENSAIVKGLYALTPRWKLKAKTSYKNQLLVESEDEKLGKGLYDNNKYGAGLEAERTGKLFRSIRFSLDPYGLRYIRYASLASGTEFGSEINSGANTLDFNAYDATMAADIQLGKRSLLQLNHLTSYRLFLEQKKVTTSGLYTADDRNDVFNQTNLGLSHVLPDWFGEKFQIMAGLDASYAFLTSNQNNYDAARTKFNENYYGYSEYHAGPRFAARFFDLELGVSYDYGRRLYADRPIQDASGSYLSDKIRIDTHSINYSFRYPIIYGFSAIAQGVYRRSNSNIAYERTYRYNYVAQHYFLGLSWEY